MYRPSSSISGGQSARISRSSASDRSPPNEAAVAAAIAAAAAAGFVLVSPLLLLLLLLPAALVGPPFFIQSENELHDCGRADQANPVQSAQLSSQTSQRETHRTRLAVLVEKTAFRHLRPTCRRLVARLKWDARKGLRRLGM